jgi:hypothetical protein
VRPLAPTHSLETLSIRDYDRQNTDTATLRQTLSVSKAAAPLIEFFFGGESLQEAV